MHALVTEGGWTTEVLRDDSDLRSNTGTIEDRLIGLSRIARLQVRVASFYETFLREVRYQFGGEAIPRPIQDELSGCVHVSFRRENATYRAELELLEQSHNRRVRTEVKVFNGRGALPVVYEERVFEGGGCKLEAVHYLNDRRDALNLQYFSS